MSDKAAITFNGTIKLARKLFTRSTKLDARLRSILDGMLEAGYSKDDIVIIKADQFNNGTCPVGHDHVIIEVCDTEWQTTKVEPGHSIGTYVKKSVVLIDKFYATY